MTFFYVLTYFTGKLILLYTYSLFMFMFFLFFSVNTISNTQVEYAQFKKNTYSLQPAGDMGFL